jgi:hypothetical protein
VVTVVIVVVVVRVAVAVVGVAVIVIVAQEERGIGKFVPFAFMKNPRGLLPHFFSHVPSPRVAGAFPWRTDESKRHGLAGTQVSLSVALGSLCSIPSLIWIVVRFESSGVCIWLDLDTSCVGCSVAKKVCSRREHSRNQHR